MDDLTAFVTARLDEDEAAAKKYAESARRIGYTTDDEIDGWNLGMHPMQDLRDIAAKRRMLSEVVEQIDGLDRALESELGNGGYSTTGESDLLLKLLAAPYSDHPGYRREWAPEGAPDR